MQFSKDETVKLIYALDECDAKELLAILVKNLVVRSTASRDIKNGVAENDWNKVFNEWVIKRAENVSDKNVWKLKF